MREIVFDTETTGLDNRADRIIEVGGIELVNRFPTGRFFHEYINPDGRPVHPEALAIHGISDADLADKPKFSEIAGRFLEFIDGAVLVAHNATFDFGFINAELQRLGQPPVGVERMVDTLALARRKHPMGPNSLDALCRRYGIDNSRRDKHGALLDSELLAEVYIELIGGKQAVLVLDSAARTETAVETTAVTLSAPVRERILPARLSAEEIEAHRRMVEKMGGEPVWKKISGTAGR